MKIYPKSFRAEMEFCKIDPWFLSISDDDLSGSGSVATEPAVPFRTVHLLPPL
jgi:hypothetical protein